MNQIRITKDNSPTLYSDIFDQTYHSIHGALSESIHVFIENGLKLIPNHTDIAVFEVGYGTGINAMLTYEYSKTTEKKISYESIELYPIEKQTYQNLAFENAQMQHSLFQINELPWNELKDYQGFKILKVNDDLMTYSPGKDKFDIVFFDAFSPNSQPELWNISIFEKMYDILRPRGILTTYCAKGEVKRTMRTAGFEVQSRPGPPGKREMTVAIKN